MADVLPGFDIVQEAVIPNLYFGFTTMPYQATFDGCARNITIPAGMNLRKSYLEQRPSFLKAIDLVAVYQRLIAAADFMVGEFLRQSAACGLTLTTRTTALWQLIQSPRLFMNFVNNEASSVSFILNAITIALGVLCVLLAIAFHYVSRRTLEYIIEEKQLPDKLLDVQTAGRRVDLARGSKAVIVAAAESARLRNQPCVLLSDGADQNGLITVKLHNQKMAKVEEWQLARDETPERAAHKLEMAELRVAHAKSTHEAFCSRTLRSARYYKLISQVLLKPISTPTAF